MLLLLSLARPNPPRLFGKVIAPSSQPLSRQRDNLAVAELGPDVGEVATSGVANRVCRPAIALEEIKIGVHRVGDGPRPAPPGRSTSTLHHALASQGLRLSKVEDGYAIGIAEIVCGGDGLHVVRYRMALGNSLGRAVLREGRPRTACGGLFDGEASNLPVENRSGVWFLLGSRPMRRILPPSES